VQILKKWIYIAGISIRIKMINKNISDFSYIKVDIRKITCVKLNKINRKQYFFCSFNQKNIK
jgi:hypothetical protein